MKKILTLIGIILLFALPVQAMEITPPSAPATAQEIMPKQSANFGDDLLYIFKNAIGELRPDIAEATTICACLIGIVLLVAMIKCYAKSADYVTQLVGTLCIAVLLVKPTNAFLQLGIQTVTELSEYGKLFLPVMTTAIAAEGGITTATGLYTGTVLFNSLLSTAISKLIIPMIYIFISLAVANGAIQENVLKNLKNFVKWLITWSLKIALYLFTGFISITGVISGTVDSASVKATKLALSGIVPVVGSVMSDASEVILVSAGVMKNAAGIYGLLTMIAICIIPFLRIGFQYILLKLCGAVCGVFGAENSMKLIEDFTSVMGILLAMTGCVCLLHLVSTVCFMRGIG